MGQIIHPQKKEVKGPWLLNHEDFESLHEVIETIDRMLYQSWGNKIEIEIQEKNKDISIEELSQLTQKEKKNGWNDKHIKNCVITSKDEIKLRDESIHGLLKDKTLEQLKPNTFNINISHGLLSENSFDLKVSNFYDGSLYYDISCSQPDLKDEIQYEIDKWIDKRKTNTVLQKWAKYGDLIAIFSVILVVILAIQSFSKSYVSYTESLRLEMYELGQAGINDTNRDLAIELLTKLGSGFMPKNYEPVEKPNDPIWIKLFAVAVFISLVSIFRPKTLIGLGKMKRILIIYKTWIKIVSVTVPTMIILGPLWKAITKWLFTLQ